ncbi:MAG TPA: discoidin domain-containing protein [Polyangiaceae bacterium]|nr:discoidin domain-containing protein [Polyangiaceae bacterium]
MLVWGCAVYDDGLRSGGAGAPSSAGAGAGAVGGEAGSGAGGIGAGSGASPVAGDNANGARAGSGGTGGTGGTGAVSGGDAAVSGGGDGSALAGAPAGGEGGAAQCVPETASEFCKRLGKDCGSVDGANNCGDPMKGVKCGTCQGFKQCGGAGEANVCGALTDPTQGGVATASSVWSIAEDGQKAFDLSTSTKWYNGDNNGGTGWLAYQFAGLASHVVTSYSVTSANDVPQRDPTAWELQGSNNGGTWAVVDQRTGVTFAARLQTNSYTCANSVAYRWYRLFITGNAGATSLQLAELVLYGN